jgi:hypothetical protein
MAPDPLGALLRSRKFWILVADVVCSTILFFIGKYASASMLEDVKFLIAAYQPVVLVLIGAIAYEDSAAKSAHQ